MIGALDTHEVVKDLKAAGFNDDQAEAVTRALSKARDIDLSNLATKADLTNVATKADLANFATKADLANLATKVELAELKAELIKWVVGIAFAQIATIVAILKLFPGAHS